MPSTYRSEVVVGVIFLVALGTLIYVNFIDHNEHDEEEVIFARVREISLSKKGKSEESNSGYYNEERKSIIDCEKMFPIEFQSPRFLGSIPNITVTKGENVSIPCVAENLGSFRMAWLRLQSQTILTIHDHVITKNARIKLSLDNQTLSTPCKNKSIESTIMMYTLHIDSVNEKDEGYYMCQLNTDPMKGQWGFLKIEEEEEEVSPTIFSISS